MGKLEGKVAVITGGTEGIGLAALTSRQSPGVIARIASKVPMGRGNRTTAVGSQSVALIIGKVQRWFERLSDVSIGGNRSERKFAPWVNPGESNLLGEAQNQWIM